MLATSSPSGRSALRAWIAGALVLAAAPVARAESAPAGSHRIVHEIRVDLGTWREFSAWRYEVRPGDTLSQIAQRRLGRSKRQKDILLLNPGLDPNVLRPGMEIWMPPGRSPGWHFFAVTTGDAPPVRIASGDALPSARRGVRLLGVPHERLVRILGGAKPRRLTAALLEDDPATARAESLLPLAHLPDEDAAARVVTHYRLEAIDGGSLTLWKTDERRLGAGGVLLSSLADVEASPDPLLIGMLAGIAALALALLVARWVLQRRKETEA